MKKIITIILACYSFSFFAQVASPTVEATYLPVAGTSVKQAWDTQYGTLTVPAAGTNMFWDYSNQFTHVAAGDTFQIKTMFPSQTPYEQYFPTATHATFLRAPAILPLLDSLYSYIRIDQTGLYNVGGFTQKYDSLFNTNPPEKYLTPFITYGQTNKDTSRLVGYLNHYPTQLGSYNVKAREWKAKDVAVIGYGTLAVPNATYNNVLLAREIITQKDSIFPDFFGNGTYATTAATVITQNYISYYFLRNNTFGTSYLMFLTSPATNTNVVSYGYYNIPVDIGSISGTVFTNTLETIPVTAGEAYLYRENSNFAKNDILVTVPLDGSGNYQFDSIPYGIYRVAIRPDTNIYHNAFITYYGDTTDWILADTINTSGHAFSNDRHIHLQYQAPAGLGQISGIIGSNPSIMKTMSNIIPGVGTVVKKNPGGGASRVTVSDNNGVFNIGNLADGTYELFVDIPGLYMADTYTFVISGGNAISCLDFAVGTNSIHPTCNVVTTIKEHNTITNSIQAFPNPYASSTTISLNLAESKDVVLEVYNLLGEKIQVLDKGLKQKGTYSYTFSAKHIYYPAGMYIIKLSTGDRTSTLKIIEQ